MTILSGHAEPVELQDLLGVNPYVKLPNGGRQEGGLPARFPLPPPAGGSTAGGAGNPEAGVPGRGRAQGAGGEADDVRDEL